MRKCASEKLYETLKQGEKVGTAAGAYASCFKHPAPVRDYSPEGLNYEQKYGLTRL